MSRTNNPASSMSSLRRWHAHRERSLELLSLDDTAWEALGIFRQDFAKARAGNDEEALHALIDYGAEVLAGPSSPEEAENDWVDAEFVDLASPAQRAQVEADRNHFFRCYARAKAASSLKTQRQIADAAGLSPTTVHAIEAGRIKPQFRTIEKLAAAFGVAITDLLGSSPAGAATARDGHPLVTPPTSEKKRPSAPDRSSRRIGPTPPKKRSA